MNKHLALPPWRPAAPASLVTRGVTALRDRGKRLIEWKFLVLDKGSLVESGAVAAGGFGDRPMTQSKAHSGLLPRSCMVRVRGVSDTCQVAKGACAKDDSVAVRAL